MTAALQCPGCGVLWSEYPGRSVKSYRVWDEREERWIWALNAKRRWCSVCAIKTPTTASKTQRARSKR